MLAGCVDKVNAKHCTNQWELTLAEKRKVNFQFAEKCCKTTQSDDKYHRCMNGVWAYNEKETN
jgi:hypothetical protein